MNISVIFHEIKKPGIKINNILPENHKNVD